MKFAEVQAALARSAQPQEGLEQLVQRLLAESAQWPDRLVQAIAEHDRERDARDEARQAQRDCAARTQNIRWHL
jgi:hypothetical protein